MFHGRKRTEKKELSEAEIAEIDAKLNKIAQNNKTLLEKRHAKEYTIQTLAQTQKFSFLSPDYTSLWNYRREILVYLFENDYKDDCPKRLQTISDELMFLLKALKGSPKSYTLWFQRQWAIQKGLVFEHELNKSEQSKILMMEIGLCNKMLQMDERNFHCWNYRLWVVETLLTELSKRVKINSPETSDEDVWLKYQRKVVEDETKFAFGLINKNFSNYSAWHYRAKLMPKFENYNDVKYNSSYLIPIDKIREDFATLKHAYFTQPKDQSPWNHHEWLLQQITPVQVVNVFRNDRTLTFGLSHKVRNFDQLEIAVQGASFKIESASKDISSVWSMVLSEDIDSIEINISARAQSDKTVPADYKKTQFHSIDGVKLFRAFNCTIEANQLAIKPVSDPLIDNLNEVITQEFSNIKELTDFETGLRFALHSQLELKQLQYEYLKNPFYAAVDGEESIASEINGLVDSLVEQEQSRYYEKVRSSFEEVRKTWNSRKDGKLMKVDQEAEIPRILCDRHYGFVGK